MSENIIPNSSDLLNEYLKLKAEYDEQTLDYIDIGDKLSAALSMIDTIGEINKDLQKEMDKCLADMDAIRQEYFGVSPVQNHNSTKQEISTDVTVNLPMFKRKFS